MKQSNRTNHNTNEKKTPKTRRHCSRLRNKVTQDYIQRCKLKWYRVKIETIRINHFLNIVRLWARWGVVLALWASLAVSKCCRRHRCHGNSFWLFGGSLRVCVCVCVGIGLAQCINNCFSLIPPRAIRMNLHVFGVLCFSACGDNCWRSFNQFRFTLWTGSYHELIATSQCPLYF